MTHRVQPRDLPYKMKIKALSPAMLGEQTAQVTKMLTLGVIRESNSPWAHKHRSIYTWALYTFFRSKEGQHMAPQSNEYARSLPPPASPRSVGNLPGYELLHEVGCGHGGYWQIPMHPDDAKYCSFICQDGQFEFVRMPFGLMNAPATFQRFNNRILAPVLRKFCVVYLDDIIIYSRTFNDQVRILRERD